MAKTLYTLDDGTREYSICNKFGKEIAKVHIRAADISLMDRYKALQTEFPALIQPISEISLNPDGTVEDFDNDWEKFKAIEKSVLDKLSEILDADDLPNIFKTRNAFSAVGGTFFIKHVIDMLGLIVSDAMEEEAALVKQRTDKFLNDLDTEAGANAGAAPDPA